jgi:hypothetical protein
MNNLTIIADREDYGVGLTGTLSVEGFSGYGEGWFNNNNVNEFCDQASLLATEMSGTVELIGSQQKEDGSEYLETFALRCYVLTKNKLNGIIGVHVTISNPHDSDCRKEEILKVSGELQIRNHRFREFSEKLKELVRGDLNEVLLNGDLNDI